jgi:AcrR family transcriptional regulator
MTDMGQTGGTLREVQKEMTRARLVDAAIAVFETEGFRAATIEQITRRAGANRATFYLHFRNKEEVAHEIGWRLEPDLRALFQDLDLMESPSRGDVRDWLSRVAGLAWDRRALVAVAVAAEASVAGPALSADYVSFLGGFADGMTRYIARFDPAGRKAARTRLVLQCVQMERVLFVTVVRGVLFPDPHILDALADIWWEVLFAPARRFDAPLTLA